MATIQHNGPDFVALKYDKFPTLPKLFFDKNLLQVFNYKSGKERKLFATLVVVCCAYLGSWQPISLDTLFDFLEKKFVENLMDLLLEEMWVCNEDNFVDLTMVGETVLIIPTQDLAELALG